MLRKNDKDTIQSYFEDSSGLVGGHADAVNIPDNDADIAGFLKEASARRMPVTISGGGTGVAGGRIPFGGEVLSLERLNKIVDLRKTGEGSGIAVVQPGVTVKELKQAAEKEGLLYAPDPTEKLSFVGGNVGTNASGSRGLKYGSTRKYIRRLKVILSDGEIMDIPRGRYYSDDDGIIEMPRAAGTLRLQMPQYYVPRIKNAAGYYAMPGMDLIDLFIGQEGTLGVVTEIEVSLLPMIERTIGGVAFFTKKELAWAFVEEIKSLSKDHALGRRGTIEALSLEYMDRNALELLRGDYPQIPSFADAALLFEQDTTAMDEDAVVEAWSKVLVRYDAPLDKVWFSVSRKEQEGFKEFRHRLPERVNEIVNRNRLPKVGTDIAVPDRQFRRMMEYYYERFIQSGMQYLVFGHIGENHIHANILPQSEEQYRQCKALYTEIAETAVGFGGTVSAEHGIGKIKHHFLEKMIKPEGMKEMARVKKTLDPASILSPGNLFPKELLEG